jgi:hypothetical protein
VRKRCQITTNEYESLKAVDKQEKKYILRTYLGLLPAWFDLRKKEIIKDNINIKQWQINMNYLICNHGTIDSCEQKAFQNWASKFENLTNGDYEDFLEENATGTLINLSESDLPRILSKNQDRNWFLSAYPDVMDYFYPQFDMLANDFDAERIRVEEKYKVVSADYEKMEKYLLKGKLTQTLYLIGMKNFYKHELEKNNLLCS